MDDGDDKWPPTDDLRQRIEQKIQIYNREEGLIDLSRCGIDGNTIEWVVDRLRSLVDLQKVDISDNNIGDAGAVAIAKHLTALTTLKINQNSIGDTGALAIAEQLTALTTLHIWNNSIGEAGAVAIAKHLTALTTLSIWGNSIGDAGAVAIGEHLTALTALDISVNSIGAAGAVFIAKRLSALTDLQIASNSIGEAAAIAIAEQLSALTDLGIANNFIGEAGAVAIAEHLPALTTLDISWNSIGAAGAVAIAERLTALTTLSIGGNSIGAAGAVAIAEHLQGLTKLDLERNSIGAAGVRPIAEHLSALKRLNIGGNSIGAAGAFAIAKRLAALTTLDIGGNSIGDAGVVAIAEHLTALTTLSVEGNAIGNPGAVAIAKHLKSLTTLNIGRNSIGAEGAVAIAENLSALTTLNININAVSAAGALAIAEHLTALTTLNINNNAIGAAGALAIAERLTALTYLDIAHNSIGAAGAFAIAERLTALTTLSIGGNSIGARGAVAIAEQRTALKRLFIGNNFIGEAGVVAIGEYLPALIALNIERNLIGGAEVVVAFLQKRISRTRASRLKSIEIGNSLGWAGVDGSISENTLRQRDPEKLYRLLLNSRPGVGEGLLTARATIAGLGMSGKTRLSRWLVDHPNKKDDIDVDDRTIGIEPLETKITGQQFDRPALGEIMLTILDCGGQQEQLQSHHNLVYKASGRSLFILCLHAGKDFRSREGNRADYYLRMLQSYRAYGDRPLPVLIVVTHGELTGTPERKLQIPAEDELRHRYEKLQITTIDPYFGHVGKEIEDVRRAIVDFLAGMPEIRAMLPKGLRSLQDAVRKKFQLDQPLPPDPRELRIRYPSLSPGDFSEICAKHGMTDESLHGDYLRHLANLGVVIAPGVEETVSADVRQLDSVVSNIFNPRYVNKYVYGLLMDNRLREQKGFLKESDFREETTRLTKADRNALRNLLKEYLVAFEWKHGDENGLLIPDLLPERVTQTKWDNAICGATLHFRDVFLGEPRFFEFLSKHKSLIKPLELNKVERRMAVRPIGLFRNEVCLSYELCEALVRTDIIESRIEVIVRGATMAAAGQFRERIVASLVPLELTSSTKTQDEGPVPIFRWQSDQPGGRPRKRGRPGTTPAAQQVEERLFRRWKASGELSYEDFARRHGVAVDELKKIIDRVRKRGGSE